MVSFLYRALRLLILLRALESRPVVPNRGSMDPQGSTEGFLGVHGLYMYTMKAK